MTNLMRRPSRPGDRRVIYHVATEPREWRGGKTYIDIETGLGFALPEEYVP